MSSQRFPVSKLWSHEFKTLLSNKSRQQYIPDDDTSFPAPFLKEGIALRLLVVDDEAAVRRQLRRLFVDEGYKVVIAASGKEAIAALANFSPDIVITDLVMSNGDGYFMLEQFLEQGIDCPVIVITGYASQESAVKALRLGAYDYVTKPFDLDVISAAVRRAAENRRLQLEVDEGRKRQETQISELSALYDTSLDLVSHLSLSQVLQSLLARAIDLLHAQGGNIHLYDEAAQQLTVVASRGPWSDYTGHTLHLGEGLAGRVAQSGQPLRVDDYSNWDGCAAEYENCGFISVVGVPLIVQNRALGVLNVEDDDAQRGGFSEVDEALLMRLAPLAALAIERARLFEQESKRCRLADMLRGVLAIIGSTLDLEELQTLILEQIAWVFTYDSCALFQVQDGRADLVAWQPFSEPSDAPPRELSETPRHLFSTLLKGRHALVLSKVPAEMRWPVGEQVAVQSWIGAPLVVRDRILGFLTINSYTANTYKQEDESLMMAFARQAASALANAHLYAEAERNWREQEYLQEIAQVFNSTLDLQQVLTLVMTKTNELLGVEAGSVALLTPDRRELVFRAAVGGGANTVTGYRMPADAGIVGWVIQHQESLLVPDVGRDPRHYVQVDDESGFETRSILCVPLMVKGKVIGAIEVLNKIEGGFDADDLRMTEALALSAAAAIENARLFQREKQAVEKLAQAQDKLIHAQRLAAVAQIGVTVGHEVNNPLTVVLGNADWLLKELPDLKGEPRKALETIRANALRIQDIVKKLEDVQSDRVMEYAGGVEMIDIHGQGDTDEQEGEGN